MVEDLIVILNGMKGVILDNLSTITNINFLILLSCAFFFYFRRKKNKDRIDSLFDKNFHKLSDENKRCFVDIRARWSSDVQTIIFSFATFVVGIFGVYFSIRDYLPMEVRGIILLNLFFTGTYLAGYTWFFYFIPTRIGDMEKILKSLLPKKRKVKKK